LAGTIRPEDLQQITEIEIVAAIVAGESNPADLMLVGEVPSLESIKWLAAKVKRTRSRESARRMFPATFTDVLFASSSVRRLLSMETI
jgi:primosomal protein N'